MLAAIIASTPARATETITLSPAGLPSGVQGQFYNQPVIAADGDTEDQDPTSTDSDDIYTYAVTAGALPPGLTLGAGPTAGGVPISGTPTAAGTYSFTVTATSGDTSTGSQAYTLIIAPPPLVITPSSLPPASQNIAYNQTVSASGGTGPYTYIVLSGSLPPGLSLNSATGAITGTPTTGGSYGFTIQASDQFANTGTQAYTINVGTNILTLMPASLPAGTQNVPYSQTVTASGGNSPYTYSVASGALPAGLSLNPSTGAITGTPTTGGLYNFTILATDTQGNTASQAYAVNIGTNSLTVNPASLPAGTQNVPYNQTISAVGGTGPYTLSVSSGALPAGLAFNPSTGVISGAPTGSGSSTFTISALDSQGNTGSRAYTVNIGTSSLTVNPTTLPNGSQGTPYNQTVVATGGTGPYTYSVSSGTLPTGLALNAASGAITGTPTGSGSSTVTISALDSQGNTGSRAYTVNIGTSSLTVNPATLPNGSQGTPYNQTVIATGGTGPYTFSVSSGALPAGLALNPSTGVISGTPTGSGSSTFTISALDSQGNTGSRSYTMNVGTNSLTVNPATLAAGTQGTPYNQTVVATGGTGPYTYSVSSGTLPTGLALNPSTGAITGTPTGSGLSTFTISALDSQGNTGSRAYTVNVGTSSLTVSPATLPNGSQGTPYNQTVVATGGTGPYTYSVSSGTLPTGLALNSSTGAITGTATGSGPSTFTISALDSKGNTGSRAYTINVGTSSLTVSPATLPNGSQGTPYNQTVVATGGTGPYTYSVSSGTLPAGLALNSSTGAITGTATGSGLSTFTISALDSKGNTGGRAYTMNIGSNSLTINPASLPAASQGTPYRQTVAATGGSGPYTYTISSGALPTGLSLNASTGQITGTPTALGNFSFTIVVRDSLGDSGSRSYTVGTARLDPSLDPDVQGLVAAQAAAARRFAGTQIGNIMQHLEGLHGDFDPCAVNMDINLSTVPARPVFEPPDPVAAAPPLSPAEQVARRMPSEQCTKDRWWTPIFAFWAGGSIQLGSTNANGLSVDNRFSTAGVTAGVDVRVVDGLIVGGAFGYGTDHTDIGTLGTSTDGRSLSGTVYASYQPIRGWFIDGLVGYGYLDFNNHRFVTIDSSSVAGERTGGSWFGSLGLSTEIKLDPWKFMPYLRAEFATASLGAYSEQGGTNQALTFGTTSFTSTSAVLGVRTSYEIATSWGMITPTLRTEYRHELDGGLNQPMYYTDIGSSVTYGLLQSAVSHDLFTTAIGVRARDSGVTSLDFEYGATIGTDSALTHTLRATARIAF